MSQSAKLQTESILQVPLEKYEKNFTFIVNGESFQTNKLVADLLSPKISNIHSTDPTLDKFSIDTHVKGDFQRFLSLISFKKEELTEKDVYFFLEIIEKLETDKIDLKVSTTEITIDNIIDKLQVHSLSHNYYAQEYKNEIDFISQNFYKICEKNDENLLNLSASVFKDIFTNENFQIETEDQLLTFVNQLYSKSNDYSNLYECVYFSNVSVKCIENFLSIFKIKDLNQGIWESLSKRLKKQVCEEDEKCQKNRSFTKSQKINGNNDTNNQDDKNGLDAQKVENQSKSESIQNENDTKSGGFTEFLYSNKDFDGIFNFLQKNSNIEDEVKITFSSFNYGQPENLIQFDNKDFFGTGNKSNSWICFEFTKRCVIPKSYTIKSCDYGENWLHPKSWVIEGSMNSTDWEIIDEQIDSSIMRGANIIHTFHLKNENNKEFKFLRIRQTGQNWKNNNCFYINCIEFYGLIN